jgi:LDH2 family malate/lactate/ureidoglycolate dehydrogenase
LVADHLAFCDLRGIDSHGIMRFQSYVRRIEEKGTNARPQISIIQEGPSTALIDGDNGMGPVVGTFASDLVIRKAERTGAAFACVRNSSHYGAASYYTVKIAMANMIGLSSTNVTPVMSCVGGKGRAIGNNPLSIAVLRSDRSPVVLDMAMSEVSGGKIKLYSDAGQKIPKGWIVDHRGRDTENPSNYFKGGALLPVGAHKGYGLAVMLEILTGILAGANTLSSIPNWLEQPSTPLNISHCFMAMNISSFMKIESFHQRLESMIGKIKGAPRKESVADIYFPGELEMGVEAQRSKAGIPISETVWRTLTDLSRKYDEPLRGHFDGNSMERQTCANQRKER